MRVIIAPFGKYSEETLATVRSHGYDVLGNGTNSCVFAEIVSQAPLGWHPDAFLFISPEYNAVPRGLGSAGCFKAATFGDWNLGGQAVQQVAGMFDLILADAKVCERLRDFGRQNVAVAQLFEFDPAVHRRVPDVPRDLDIVMAGNFNHDVQRERAPWLARVARLSSRYKVCLTSGVYGEAYTQLMNRAKIVFNRSIRGEINMRAYEAAACGALMFYERENAEIASLFTDRKECVLYGDDDIEELLEYYLSHETEREAIAEAGCKRVQRETPAAHLISILDTIARARGVHSGGAPATWSLLPDADRELRRARQWLLSTTSESLGGVEEALQKAEQAGADACTVAGLRGYLFAQAGRYIPGVNRSSAWNAALQQWTTAAQANAANVSPYFNLASLFLECGQTAAAEGHLQTAMRLVSDDAAAAIQPGDLYWPCRFDPFGIEYDRIEILFDHGSEEWLAAMSALLTWRAHELLAQIAYSDGRFAEAARSAGEACARAPQIAATHFAYGRALNALGCADKAIAAYRGALDRNPFQTDARLSLVRLLIDCQRPAEAITVLDDWTAIAAGCPPYSSQPGEWQQLRAAAERQLVDGPVGHASMLRLLAFPDWKSADHWCAALDAFVLRTDRTPALLMLWADPAESDPGSLLNRIAVHFTTVLKIRPADFPNITIVSEAFAPHERWKLFRAANAIVGAIPAAGPFEELFRASGLPLISIDDIRLLAA